MIIRVTAFTVSKKFDCISCVLLASQYGRNDEKLLEMVNEIKMFSL